jgi:2-oxoglutarate ferredoxin oxidoreductase subunit gamma
MEAKMSLKKEVMIAGVGGWGIVTMGDILAKAAMRAYKHVSWFPSYATMMRGGDSECCVIFSDEKIASPIIYRSGVVVVLGARRVPDFEDRVAADGLLIVDISGVGEDSGPADTSQIKKKPDASEAGNKAVYKVKRSDIQVEYVSAMDTALRLGNTRNANLVMLGAYVGRTGVLPQELLLDEIEKRFLEKGGKKVVSDCKEAFVSGMGLFKE